MLHSIFIRNYYVILIKFTVQRASIVTTLGIDTTFHKCPIYSPVIAENYPSSVTPSAPEDMVECPECGAGADLTADGSYAHCASCK